MNEQQSKNPRRETVQFRNGSLLPSVAVVGGVIMALGVPYIVLRYGADLTHAERRLAVFCSLGVGGLVAVIAAFFGTVMPSSVDSGGGGEEGK